MNFEALAANWQMAVTAVVVAGTLLGLLFIQRAPDMIMFGGVVVLMLTGILGPAEALQGMAHEGMISVATVHPDGEVIRHPSVFSARVSSLSSVIAAAS
jgi:hypothetical protein